MVTNGCTGILRLARAFTRTSLRMTEGYIFSAPSRGNAECRSGAGQCVGTNVLKSSQPRRDQKKGQRNKGASLSTQALFSWWSRSLGGRVAVKKHPREGELLEGFL